MTAVVRENGRSALLVLQDFERFLGSLARNGAFDAASREEYQRQLFIVQAVEQALQSDLKSSLHAVDAVPIHELLDAVMAEEGHPLDDEPGVGAVVRDCRELLRVADELSDARIAASQAVAEAWVEMGGGVFPGAKVFSRVGRIIESGEALEGRRLEFVSDRGADVAGWAGEPEAGPGVEKGGGGSPSEVSSDELHDHGAGDLSRWCTRAAARAVGITRRALLRLADAAPESLPPPRIDVSSPSSIRRAWRWEPLRTGTWVKEVEQWQSRSIGRDGESAGVSSARRRVESSASRSQSPRNDRPMMLKQTSRSPLRPEDTGSLRDLARSLAFGDSSRCGSERGP